MLAPTVLLTSTFLTTTTASNCFNSKGKLWSHVATLPIEPWIPCNSSAHAVSNCCAAQDYCMSNGLCMDAAVDNMMSQQGCTSKTWDREPCKNYCGGTESDITGRHFLWRCDGQVHCCGNNRSLTCCDDEGAKLVTVEVGKMLHQPNMIVVPEGLLTKVLEVISPETTSNALTPSTSISTALSSPATPYSQPSSGIVTASTPSAVPQGGTDSEDRSADVLLVLQIGMWICITLIIALIAALVFVGLQFRRSQRPLRVAEMSNDAKNDKIYDAGSSRSTRRSFPSISRPFPHADGSHASPVQDSNSSFGDFHVLRVHNEQHIQEYEMQHARNVQAEHLARHGVQSYPSEQQPRELSGRRAAEQDSLHMGQTSQYWI